MNPLGYARGLAQAAVQAGAAVHGATPALGAKRNGTWQVRTPSGAVRADKLVLATNGYTDDVWPGLRRSIVPVFSAIVASEPLPLRRCNRCSTRQGGYCVYRLDRANRLLMGGRSMQRDVTKPRTAVPVSHDARVKDAYTVAAFAWRFANQVSAVSGLRRAPEIARIPNPIPVSRNAIPVTIPKSAS